MTKSPDLSPETARNDNKDPNSDVDVSSLSGVRDVSYTPDIPCSNSFQLLAEPDQPDELNVPPLLDEPSQDNEPRCFEFIGRNLSAIQEALTTFCCRASKDACTSTRAAPYNLQVNRCVNCEM
jgi:hypothetical protein